MMMRQSTARRNPRGSTYYKGMRTGPEVKERLQKGRGDPGSTSPTLSPPLTQSHSPAHSPHSHHGSLGLELAR